MPVSRILQAEAWRELPEEWPTDSHCCPFFLLELAHSFASFWLKKGKAFCRSNSFWVPPSPGAVSLESNSV